MRFLFVFFVFLTVALCAAHSPLAHCQPYRLIIPCRWPPGIAKESCPPPDETAVPVPLLVVPAKPRTHLPLKPTGPHHGASSTLILSVATPLVALMVVLFFF